MKRRSTALLIALCGSAPFSPRALPEVAAATGSMLPNGGFESGLSGWGRVWARSADNVEGALDVDLCKEGAHAFRVEHTGELDWSLSRADAEPAQPGDIFELSAWVRVRGAGDATLSVVTRDVDRETLNWTHGARTAGAAEDWQRITSRFIVPAKTASILPRVTGHKTATVWIDDVRLEYKGSINALRATGLPAIVSLRNETLDIGFRTADAAFAIRDLRTGREWIQAEAATSLLVLGAESRPDAAEMSIRLLDPGSLREFSASVILKDAELAVSLRGEGALPQPVSWPPPFRSEKGQWLIAPVNEGISYPVDDAHLTAMHYHLYGGHGLCMPWYGATDGERGWMALVETPDDAAVDIPRRDGLLRLAPEWQAQRGEFGADRTLRYVFFDRGGYVAMAKRYRAHAQATGLFRTLKEKQEAVPAVDRLVGAANIWCWDKDALSFCREMRELGVQRILWSNALPPDQIKALNDMGVLTSRYDVYQDAMDPAQFPRLRHIHGDWTSDAWANGDLLLNAGGAWARGWEVEARDGGRIPCGVLCDRQAVAYARRRIPAELATHPYGCRFIDTTTASPWRECHDPRHPMTRSDSRRYKMELLGYVSAGCGLVCGSETGHDAAVPYVHYFEGMLSLGPYRVPDSGRDIQRLWDEVPERVARFQTGHTYRLPLWELVYHDCVVAQWYWGDYNNKLPSLWDRRDLWNLLYGTPPMLVFNRDLWRQHRERFAQSLRTIEPVARATGYSEMISHEWLTPDHAVQRTRFANGTTVTVNFGDTPLSLPNGAFLPALAHRIEP